MSKITKILAVLLCLMMVVCQFAACDNASEPSETTAETEAITKAEATETETETETKTEALLPSSEGLKFELNEDEKSYTVVGIGSCADPNIIIGSYNNLPVTGIGDRAFYAHILLSSVTICNSVTSIGEDAFNGCAGLTNVYITDLANWCKIQFGNDRANPLFYAPNLHLNNELVTSLVIPNSVTSIGEYAFCGFTGLTSITIGNSVTSIGKDAFRGCAKLTNVCITNLENWCQFQFNNYDANPLYYATNLYLNNELVTNLVVPDSVTNIGSYVFYNCKGLTSITIPNSVTSIGTHAFYDCKSLTSVTIGNGITSIDSQVFNGCSSLTSVYITNIANWCQIQFGTYLDNPLCYTANLYLNNELVTSLVIPDGVTSIGDYAFRACDGLTGITIPDSVTSIGKQAFNCTNLTSLTIPNSVTSIGDSAFNLCTDLTSIVIPNSVTSIGNKAFYVCSSLTDIYYTGTEEEWNAIEKAEAEIPSSATIHYNYTPED